MKSLKQGDLTALSLSLISSFFFASTFVINKLMANHGGSWIWSASLRFFFMVPFLLVIVSFRNNLSLLYREMRVNLKEWLLWSSIGFGVFYALLTYASSYNQSWVVAATWQISIIAGMIIAPFIKQKEDKNTTYFSFKILLFSILIIAGVIIMQVQHAKHISLSETLTGVLPVVIAAFAYPLGNRKMMQLTSGKLHAIERTLGMTLASLPIWLILSIYALYTENIPSSFQVSQTLSVAIFSGVIGTSLFFVASDIARKNPLLLSSVEALQSGEILFTLAGEIFILQGNFPDIYSSIGIMMIISGIILHSLSTVKRKAHKPERRALI